MLFSQYQTPQIPEGLKAEDYHSWSMQCEVQFQQFIIHMRQAAWDLKKQTEELGI